MNQTYLYGIRTDYFLSQESFRPYHIGVMREDKSTQNISYIYLIRFSTWTNMVVGNNNFKENCGDVHSSNFIVVHDINHSDSTMVQLSIWMPGPRCPH